MLRRASAAVAVDSHRTRMEHHRAKHTTCTLLCDLLDPCCVIFWMHPLL